MNSKFNELFDKIITESKEFKKKHIIKEDNDLSSDIGTDSGEGIEVEDKKAPAQLSEEQKKANFEAIVAKVKAAFDEYGVDCNEEEWEDEEGRTVLNAEWRWENKNYSDDYLGLSYCGGEAEEENNGSVGDLDLTDVEGTAKYLIDEYIFNPEYGGIGCEDRTLDEVVPELIEQWKNDGEHDDIDWESVDEEEFIDENIDTPFETEDDIAAELEDWLYENYSKEEDED